MSYIYVVQMNIPAQHEAEFNRIYDTEHVPIGREGGLVAVELDHRQPDDAPQSVADQVADDRAERGCDNADCEQEIDSLRPEQHHRDEEQVGRHWEKRAVGKRNPRQRPGAVAMVRQGRDAAEPAATRCGGGHLNRAQRNSPSGRLGKAGL